VKAVDERRDVLALEHTLSGSKEMRLLERANAAGRYDLIKRASEGVTGTQGSPRAVANARAAARRREGGPVRGEVIHGDAGRVLRQLARRRGWNPARAVVLTDPPWPGCEHVDIHGAANALQVWRRVARLVPAVADRLILQLGRGTDPRGMLAAVPAALPFATTVSLRMVPSGYRGCFMGGDVAYVFGERMRMPRRADGTHERTLPGEIVSNGPEHARARAELDHPCPRSPMHLAGLVRWYCAEADYIIDPFCGSGTTLVAASLGGIPYIGIDSDERWVEESVARLERIEAQGLLDLEVVAVEQLALGGASC